MINHKGGGVKCGTRTLLAAATHEEASDLVELIQDASFIDEENVVLLYPFKQREYPFPFEVQYLPVGRSGWGKIISFFHFVFFVIKLKPDVIFTGFSSLKYRIVSKVFNIRHVSFLRGILVNPNVRSGFCDKVKFLNIPFLSRLEVFNTYYADAVLVTSYITKNFIKERGLKDESIYEVGLPYLAIGDEDNQASSKNGKLIFLTQAFESHGLPEYQREQINFINKLMENGACDELMVIRVHPRDYFDYGKEFPHHNVVINKEDPRSFLKSVNSTDLIITPMSTYAFELMRHGCSCVFYSTDKISGIYGQAYDMLGVPVLYPNDISGFLRCENVREKFLSIGVDIFYPEEERKILLGKISDAFFYS